MVVRDLGSRVNRCMNTFVYLVCKDQVRPILMPVLSWFGAGGVGFVWFGLVSGGGGARLGFVGVWCIFCDA